MIKRFGCDIKAWWHHSYAKKDVLWLVVFACVVGFGALGTITFIPEGTDRVNAARRDIEVPYDRAFIDLDLPHVIADLKALQKGVALHGYDEKATEVGRMITVAEATPAGQEQGLITNVRVTLDKHIDREWTEPGTWEQVGGLASALIGASAFVLIILRGKGIMRDLKGEHRYTKLRIAA